jgi:hypothetical protein
MKVAATRTTETMSADFLFARAGCESAMRPTSQRDRFISSPLCSRANYKPHQTAKQTVDLSIDRFL